MNRKSGSSAGSDPASRTQSVGTAQFIRHLYKGKVFVKNYRQKITFAKTKGIDIMKKEVRSETIIIKNPSEKIAGFLKKLKADKAERREELLKKDSYTFTIQM